MWSFNDDVKKGMLDAGFCGQATSEDEGTGSGLGIFTKFEILETHFVSLIPSTALLDSELDAHFGSFCHFCSFCSLG